MTDQAPVRSVAQSARPSFEVASVKIAEQARFVSPAPRRSGDRISYVTTLEMALCYAYSVQPFQVSGAVLPDTFDIEATMTGSPGESQVRLMLQTLLSERFALSLHRESKEMSAYILTADGKGAKLKPAQNTIATPDAPASTGRVDLYAEKSGPRLIGKAASIAQLADGLARAMRGPVVDRTGIEGRFDFDLDCSSGDPQGGRAAVSDLLGLVSAAIARLGLKLSKGQAPVEVLVVDRVEKPSAN